MFRNCCRVRSFGTLNKHGNISNVEAMITMYRDHIQQIFKSFSKIATPALLDRYHSERDFYREQNKEAIDHVLKAKIFANAFEVVDIAERVGQSPISVAKVYFTVCEQSKFSWVSEQLITHKYFDFTEKQAIRLLMSEFRELISCCVTKWFRHLAAGDQVRRKEFLPFVKDRESCEKYNSTTSDLQRGKSPLLATITIMIESLRGLL